MGTEARRTAIDIIGDVWWGTHFCQFYQTKEDLIDILVPYFKAGLENNEFCMWVTSEPLRVDDAKAALEKEVKGLDEYLRKGQIEILDYSQWYLKSGRFDSNEVLQGWVEKERKAIENRFDGLRLTGNTFWLARKDWKDFAEYEASVNAVIGQHRMLAVCTYCLDRCSASDIIDVVSNHQFALIKRQGKWEIIESSHYKEAVAALRESETKFRNLAEQSPNMIFINQAGRIVYANKRCEQVTGYEREQLYSADFDYMRLIAEEHRESIRANFGKHMQGQEVLPFEYAIVTKGGGRLEAILTTKLIRYDGEPAILGIVTDITERKQAEEMLKAEKDFTQTALNAQLDTFFVLEPSTGRAIRWNQAFNRVSGYSDEEIRSMKAPDSYYSEQDLEKAAAVTEKILKEGVASVELDLITKDGRSIPTEYTGSLIRDEQGNRKYIIAIGRDVSERKQVQEQMWSLAKFPAEDPNPVLRISKDGTIVYANDPSSPVLETWRRRVGQRLPDACRERVKEALSSGKVRTFEFECNNGRVFFVTLAPSADGEYANAYGVDITQRKRAQDEQAESELRFRQLAENISEVFWLYDLDTDKFVYVSPAYEAIFGTSRQGLYENPRRWVDAVHTDDRARIMRDFQKERRGIPFEDEYRIVRPDGGLRWIKDRGFAISDETGRVFRIAGIAEDITERKQAENALYDSEERFRTLFEHAGDGLFLIDPESGRFIDVNQQACDALGYTRRELLALGVADVDPIYPKDKFAEFVGTLKAGQPVTIEAVHQRKDATTFAVEIRTGLIEVQGKTRLLSVVRNIAERKQTEEALRLHEARLQALLDLNKMGESSQQEILDFVREEIIKVTQSRFAFIGFLNDDGSELTMDNWSKETMAQCAVEKKPLHFAVSEAGLWADAIRLRKRIVVNDYAVARPGKKGYPAGHVPVVRFLCVPVLDGVRVAAVAAVANKETDYDETDVRALTSMMNDTWRLISRKKVKEALQESEEKYRTLLKNIPQKIFYKDLNSVYVLCNDSFAQDLKIKPQEIKGKTDHDFFPKELAEKYRADDKRILESGNAEEIEEEYVKDGKNTAVHTFKAPLRDEEGNTIGIFGIFWDITDRKQAEEALRRSEERYALAQRAANIGSWDWNIPTGQLVWSEQIEPMFGFDRGKFGGTYQAFLDSVHFEDRQFVVDSVDACVQRGRNYAIEHRIVWPDGTIRWVSETGDVIQDENGKAVRMLGIAQDITERKKVTEELKDSEERFRVLAEDAPLGVYYNDLNGTFLYGNKKAEEIVGYQREELIGKSFLELQLVGPEDALRAARVLELNRQGKPTGPDEFTINRKDGASRVVEISTQVVTMGGDRVVLGMVQDVSERKNREARQVLTARILERLNQRSEALDLVRDIISLVKESTGFAAVGVRLREGDDFPFFEINGFPHDFVRAENYLCVRGDNGQPVFDAQGRPVLECMCGSVITGRTDPSLSYFTEGGSFWTNSTSKLLVSPEAQGLQIPLRTGCNKAGFESVALIPLRSGQEIVGLLQLNDHWPGRSTPEMIGFFEGIGASIGIALARIRAEEQIENLAKFPSENPSPVLRIAEDGTVLYANSAGSGLLRGWGAEVGGQLPKRWRQYVSQVLKSGLNKEIESPCCEDRFFSLIMAPVVEAGYVNIYGTDITERKQAEEDLRKYREHLEELVQSRTTELTEANRQLLAEIEERKRLERQILNISERERRRIGQELHDSLGQQLTGIAFMTKVLERRLTDKSSIETADVAEIGKLVNQATEQARGLAKGLHPVDLDTGTLLSALEELAATTESLFGVRCLFKRGKPVPADNAASGVHLYRIAQEAVTNAVKHGRAKNIQIELAPKGDTCVLIVTSDGLDFPEDPGDRNTGMGLQIMAHRADIIGGSLDIRKGAAGGTVVTCTFPNSKRE